MPSLPAVTFVVPVLNAGRDLPRCLATVARQDYPRELVELLVADGGSTDDTRAVAASFGATVLDNPLRLAEPGVDLGMRHARGEIVVVMAADNGLPRPDWLRLMVRPFIERPDVIGAFTRIVPAPEDNAFTRYYCRLHVEPFTWFVYGAAANPARFGHAYGVAHEGEGYVLYRFTLRRHPLVALAQGFAVRRRFTRRPGFEHDDILPILQMIEDGQAIAYVPEAGIYHHHLNGLAHFARKYRWRIRNSLYGRPLGFDVRYRYLSRWRRARRYLFELYGLSAILPLLDGCALALRERDPCMLWHGPATIVLSWVILIEYARKWAGRGAGP